MAENKVSILIEAKDQASAQTKQMAEKVSGNFNLMSDSVESGLKKSSVALAALGAGLTLYEKAATASAVAQVGSAKALSRQIGGSVEDASRLQYALTRVGISGDQVGTVFNVLSKRIADARDKTADAALKQADLNNKIEAANIQIKALTEQQLKHGDSTGEIKNKIEALRFSIQGYQKDLTDVTNPLQKLGIATQNADGTNKSFNEILLSVADKFKSLPDGIDKTTAAQQLFGRSGTQMIKILNMGSDGIRDLEQQADKLGITLSTKNVAAVDRYVRASKDLKDTNDAIKLQVGTLTAPVLAGLEEKWSSVTRAILASDGPWKTITANVLAFGGPVSGAASTVLGFTSNLEQSLPVLKNVAGSLGSLASFLLTGPWGMAFAAATLAIGIVAGQFMEQDTQARRLTDAQNALKVATDGVTTAQNSLRDSNLAVQGASLSVEQAQRVYNDAVNQYGPASLEARQAAFNLEQAHNNLKEAQDKARQSQEQLQKKEQEVAKDKELINHLKETIDNLEGVRSKAFDAGQQIQLLNGSKVTVKTTTIDKGPNKGQQVVDFVSTFGKKAAGGPVQAGMPYIVGENPDGSLNRTSELFVPDQPGTILSAADTRRALSQGANLLNQVGQQPSGVNLTIQKLEVNNNIDVGLVVRELGFRLAAAL